MCSIGFVVNYGDKKLDLDRVGVMFSAMSYRGTDASGIYYEREEGGKMISRCFKAPLVSGNLWDTIQGQKGDGDIPIKVTKKIALNGTEKVVLLHARQGTHGSEFDNHNNMPIFSPHWILVHNGVVRGKKPDDYAFTGEVDSELILANIETRKSVHMGIDDTQGSMSIIMRPRGYPYLYFYRNSNPLDMVYFPKEEHVYGCSVGSYIFGGKVSEEEDLFSGQSLPKIRATQTHKVLMLGTEKKVFRDLGSPVTKGIQISYDIKAGKFAEPDPFLNAEFILKHGEK